jgi:hypothetical protein
VKTLEPNPFLRSTTIARTPLLCSWGVFFAIDGFLGEYRLKLGTSLSRFDASEKAWKQGGWMAGNPEGKEGRGIGAMVPWEIESELACSRESKGL